MVAPMSRICASGFRARTVSTTERMFAVLTG